MPTAISIKERIVRQVVRIVEGVTSIGTVTRWIPAVSNTADGDAVVKEGNERVDNAEDGNIGVTANWLSVRIYLFMLPAETATNTSARGIAFQAALETAIMANPTITETVAPTQTLAVDTKITGRSTPEFEDGRVAAVVDCEIEYHTFRTDPTQNYYGATQLTE